MNKAHLTAIKRKRLSAPMKFLYVNLGIDLVGGLDYGCGRGDDATALNMWKYDPFYYPDEYDCQFSVITCNYVLNVVPESEQGDILRKIQILLSSDGVAYVSVRRDVKKEGYTKKETYQRNVVLNLPVVYEKKNNYCIYRLTKNANII
jgi:hypothetical protein